MRVRRLLVVCVAVLACSCAPKAVKGVVGRWQTPTGGVMEFRSDGTAVMSGPTGSVELTYRFLDAKTIELKRKDGTGKPLRKRIETLTDEDLVLGGDGGALPLKRAH